MTATRKSNSKTVSRMKVVCSRRCSKPKDTGGIISWYFRTAITKCDYCLYLSFSSSSPSPNIRLGKKSNGNKEFGSRAVLQVASHIKKGLRAHIPVVPAHRFFYLAACSFPLPISIPLNKQQKQIPHSGHLKDKVFNQKSSYIYRKPAP